MREKGRVIAKIEEVRSLRRINTLQFWLDLVGKGMGEKNGP